MHVFGMLSLCSFHLISSHRSFSWKLLTASHCQRIPCHPISSHHLNLSQLIWCLLSFFFTSSHLIPSHVFSPFLSSSQLITTVLTRLYSSHVTWAFLISLIINVISAYLLSVSQIFTARLNSAQLSAAPVSSSMPSHLFSPPLTSSNF